MSRTLLLTFAAAILLPNVLAASTPVVVEILEIADDQTWPTEGDEATESFSAPAMSIPVLPRRYSDEGVIVDRQSRFIVRLSTHLKLPSGDYELLVRAMRRSRLLIDGEQVASTRYTIKHNDGHNSVPQLRQLAPNLRWPPAGHAEQRITFKSDGQPHRFVLEGTLGSTAKGGKRLRAETGEMSLSFRQPGEPSFWVMGETATERKGSHFELTDEGWEQFLASEERRILDMNRVRRYRSDKQRLYWGDRHRRAREHVESQEWESVEIDELVAAALGADARWPTTIDDYSFLRRLALDTVGVVPTFTEIEQYLADPPSQRRPAAIERYLSDDRWADHWVGYWQDVLAENPGILKPKLNNTGPFRWWIYESFLDNKPIDRFVTELIMMRGSKLEGGPAGFAMATQNDVPMAAKAHVLGQAFLGIQMKCARCHDSPQNDLRQEQLFNLAAMLTRHPQKVPETSSIPADDDQLTHLAVQVTLQPGTSVPPRWPFESLFIDLPEGIVVNEGDTRERLAGQITSYTNDRFAQVIVNRLWQRYLGRGIVDSVDDWEDATIHSPALLERLANELVANAYDLKHIARLIFNSKTYQSTVTTDPARFPLLPVRRRLSAEQVVDSLFTVCGKQLRSEALNLDLDAQRTIATFLNLGVPKRAWEFTSLSNERDRPAIAMPRAQSVVDMLLTFGWRDSRQDPLTVREVEPTVLQPGMFANGVVVQRATGLSDDSELTEACLTAESVDELVDRLCLTVLSRPPTSQERTRLSALLDAGFDDRKTGKKARRTAARRHAVSWSNHLNAEATRIKLELEREVRAGDPPTQTLVREWRERAEDVVWALVNSPEFVFVP